MRPFRIAVFGGAQAAGGEACKDTRTGATGEECAWPARLAIYLDSFYGGARRHEVESFARAGTSMCSFLPSIPHARHFDAVLFEYTSTECAPPFWTASNPPAEWQAMNPKP